MTPKTRVYTFPRGGIQYEDATAPSHDASVTAFLPAISLIPMAHYSGIRVHPVVSVGDSVTEGMLVGRGGDPGTANIHASVPGKVVRAVSWTTVEGHPNDALVIRLEGAFDRLGRPEEAYPWEGLSPANLQSRISECGVVAMESSGLPVSELLASFQVLPGKKTLVVRCVFDDPWLAADYALCRERLKAVAEGGLIAAHAAQADRILYAVSRNEQDLGDLFLAEASPFDIPASAVIVGSRYPQRNRRELELALRIYEKREELDLGGLLILGPATLAAIHDAVRLKRPILDRYVAVGGSAVKKPQVMKARIGTRIGDLFEECGGFVETPKRIATGSPLLGRMVRGLDEPVVKTTYAVFALLESQIRGGRSRNCIGCGECREVCPVGLDPEELYKASGIPGNAEIWREGPAIAGRCHGCGCCEAVCPSRLPLGAVIADYAADLRPVENSLQAAVDRRSVVRRSAGEF